MERKIVPLILAGGKGSRLWPLSRENLPKQFLCLDGDTTLLQNTLRRAEMIAEGTKPYIVAGAEQFSLVASSIGEKEGINYHFVGEPCNRNTAAAIYCGCKNIQKNEKDPIIVIMPSDQYIGNEECFCRDIKNAVSLSQKKDKIVLFGIAPDEPASVFGYIEVGKSHRFDDFHYFHVKKFKEKPCREKACEYLKKGNYYWNSGIIVCPLSLLLEMYEKHFPISEERFSQYENIEKTSIDRAVLEKEHDICLIKSTFEWNDLGSFSRLKTVLSNDRQHNYQKGNVVLKNVKDSMILSDNLLTVVIGVNDLLVVEDHGILLVCSKHDADKIGSIGEILKDENRIFR